MRPRKKKRRKISAHFSTSDFACTNEAGESRCRISLGLVGGLELLRSKSNNRIAIIKGYSDPGTTAKQYNRDYHTLGLAADIRIENMSIHDVFLLAQSIPEFKGVGLNLDEKHVHVDMRKEDQQYCWVIENKREIEWNEDAQKKYFPEPLPDSQ